MDGGSGGCGQDWDGGREWKKYAESDFKKAA